MKLNGYQPKLVGSKLREPQNVEQVSEPARLRGISCLSIIVFSVKRESSDFLLEDNVKGKYFINKLLFHTSSFRVRHSIFVGDLKNGLYSLPPGGMLVKGIDKPDENPVGAEDPDNSIPGGTALGDPLEDCNGKNGTASGKGRGAQQLKRGGSKGINAPPRSVPQVKEQICQNNQN